MKNGHLAGKGPGHHLSFLSGKMLFLHYNEGGRQGQGKDREFPFLTHIFIKKDTKNMYKMIEKEKIKGIRVFLLTE